jgi:hypothetical protein
VANAANIGGHVIAQAVGTAERKIENIRIVKSPRMGLDDSARETLKEGKCKPAVLEWKPAPGNIPIELNLRSRCGSSNPT